MARKIKMFGQSARTIEQVFDDFVIAQTAIGLSEVTLRNYKLHLHSISKHLDIRAGQTLRIPPEGSCAKLPST